LATQKAVIEKYLDVFDSFEITFGRWFKEWKVMIEDITSANQARSDRTV
jgi:hypothetical protein